jgi:RIO-like serine/threonine protein kinase
MTQTMTVKRHIILAGIVNGNEIYRVQKLQVKKWNKILRKWEIEQ